MSDPGSSSPGARFERLLGLMTRLRAPGGCPWDREQTFDSIKPYTLEETYEVLDAIDRRDFPALAEELGDFLLQAVFYAEIAREQGLFDISTALDHINGKLVRRHPHVFADGDAKTADEVKLRWDEIKKTEKSAPQRLLDGVSRSQPALAEAAQISSKAAAAGFDWPDIDGVLDKVREELDELKQAASPADREGELGDLLFTLVNVARFHKIDPEQALRRTNRKFRDRFAYVEAELEKRGRTVQQSAAAEGIRELESLWQEAKCRNPS
ncbi:MAG: nucleoside triphosphate pyrophosphohydrolase [Solibacteraceae bacterium]|nr:nucleoside triphosphate pyrophosphohydrolase [Solibacteraceae bacterium]